MADSPTQPCGVDHGERRLVIYDHAPYSNLIYYPDASLENMCDGLPEGAAKFLSGMMLGAAQAMRSCHQLTGNLSDPEEAISLAKMAAQLLPDGSSELSFAIKFLEGPSSAKSGQGDCAMDMDLAVGLIAQNAASSSSPTALKANRSIPSITVTKAGNNVQSATPFDPNDPSALENLPEEGPVVVLNVRKDASDAVVLIAELEEPLCVSLPHFSLKKANRYSAELKRQIDIRATRMRGGDEETDPAIPVDERDHVVREILRALWVEVVKPILDMLGIPVSRYITLQASG